MENDFKLFHKQLLVFTVAQAFIILSLFSYAGQIKALSELFSLFAIFDIVASILMIIAASRLVFVNRNYFYFFVTTMFQFFISLLAAIGKESTEDFTVALAKGLDVSQELLLCVIYVYFFLGTRDYFINNNLTNNVKRSKAGFIYIIVSTTLLMIISFITPFNSIKTNALLSAILRYGYLLIELLEYVFVFVILIIMIVYMKKMKRKEIVDNEKDK